MTTLFWILLANAAYFAFKAHALRIIDADDGEAIELEEAQ